jgi:hypothetical protein
VYTENLLPETPGADQTGRAGAKSTSAIKPPSAATNLIRKAIAQLDDEDGWVHLGGVGKRLAVLASDFDPRSYGQSKLVDLVKKTGAFEVRRSEAGIVHIRVKPAGGKSTSGKIPSAST